MYYVANVPKRIKIVSVRFTEEEWARVQEVVGLVQSKQPYMTEADILRELVGVAATGVITDEHRLLLSAVAQGDAALESIRTGLMRDGGKTPLTVAEQERLAAKLREKKEPEKPKANKQRKK